MSHAPQCASNNGFSISTTGVQMKYFCQTMCLCVSLTGLSASAAECFGEVVLLENETKAYELGATLEVVTKWKYRDVMHPDWSARMKIDYYIWFVAPSGEEIRQDFKQTKLAHNGDTLRVSASVKFADATILTVGKYKIKSVGESGESSCRYVAAKG